MHIWTLLTSTVKKNCMGRGHTNKQTNRRTLPLVVKNCYKWHFSDSSFRHLTTKTWKYFKQFGFFRKWFYQKKDPTLVKLCFENTMSNPFFMHFFKTKHSTKKCRGLIIYDLIFKNAFKTNFGPQKAPQPENAWQWKCRFSSMGTSQVPKSFLKAFVSLSPI